MFNTSGWYPRGRLTTHCGILVLLLASCFSSPPCSCSPTPEDRYISFDLMVSNGLDTEISVAITEQKFDRQGNAASVSFDRDALRVAKQGQRTIPQNKLVRHSYSSDYDLPSPERMVYPLFLLTLESAGQSRHYLAVGGSQQDYETYVRDQLTLPLGTEVLGYGYLYMPGDTIRQDLGLKPNKSKGTGFYTDLDPEHNAYSSYDFVLDLKIKGDSSSDIRWDFSGYHSSTQATNMQGYLGTGSSGSSAPMK